MSSVRILTELTGRWRGPSRLWMSPGEPTEVSISEATVTPVAHGRFVRLDYSWEFQGKQQEGSYLFGFEPGCAKVTAVWIDSWHMGDRYMACEGAPSERIDVHGAYSAPPGPDWGWRTVLEHSGPEAFALRMYNIAPDGREDLAVETLYSRYPGT